MNLHMEFHISKHIREKYQFDLGIFQTDGNVILGNFHSARKLASVINDQRNTSVFPESIVKASDIYAIGLMDEIFHFLFKLYRDRIDPNVLKKASDFVVQHLTEKEQKKVLRTFLYEFPPLSVYQRKETIDSYLEKLGSDQIKSQLIEEIIVLWVENQNEALDNYRELFWDKDLSIKSNYNQMMNLLINFFDEQPFFGPEDKNLIELFREPAIKVPHSIQGQLEYIRSHWGYLLGDLLMRLISGLDFIEEETKATFFGPGPSVVPEYDQLWDMDYENFTPDKDWMPSLVLIAKNTYVWLDQIRKKYNLPVYRIDQIPDEELDNLRINGFNGLWLIGLWERSHASAQIKQLCGNPEAIASAYSLAGYQIASELGGEEAFQRLKDKAWQRGIRLAADMVPNHMGIDSNWVTTHPDWFVQLSYSPFPAYSFTGPNLLNHPDIEIKIEDHYYDRTDAAVVFMYRNKHTGESRFIYHGNDGTTMPWNDTAQLNYLIPDVREAVYQTILSVAQRFPIIRFDAAMTLAKKHFQRLWFPEPGTGGAIPSRAEFGLSKEDFDKIMTNEFWRDVVDRLSVDAPDTLLLAEAFWLMESYFVRTLGMHRVYNSAFMNMLRNEDNSNYRQLIKNTIEFDPQILKRYVNFMNNPDERTAVEQFGKGDKYFGICTLMSTLPGLPMFGHGQFEGYSEKYGMEYKRAYWDEQEDTELIKRHRHQISPLLHRRWIFSEVENFLMFDFYSTDQGINEDVYVFTNFNNGQSSLVIYNNKYADTVGWINQSATKIRNSANVESDLRNMNLGQALHLGHDMDFVIFRDVASNLQYIRSISDLSKTGLFLNLHAYQTHVFLDFNQIKDDDNHTYTRLHEALNGNGVPSIEKAKIDLLLQPVQFPLKQILNRGYADYLFSQKKITTQNFINPDLFIEAQQKVDKLLQGIFIMTGIDQSFEIVYSKVIKNLEFLLSINIIDQKFVSIKTSSLYSHINSIQKCFLNNQEEWIIAISNIFISNVLTSQEIDISQSQFWFKEWNFSSIIQNFASEYKFDREHQDRISELVYISAFFSHWNSLKSKKHFSSQFNEILDQPEIQQFLLVNNYQEEVWFNKERFEMLSWWFFFINMMDIVSEPKSSINTMVEKLLKLNDNRLLLLEQMKKSKFKFNKLKIR